MHCQNSVGFKLEKKHINKIPKRLKEKRSNVDERAFNDVLTNSTKAHLHSQQISFVYFHTKPLKSQRSLCFRQGWWRSRVHDWRPGWRGDETGTSRWTGTRRGEQWEQRWASPSQHHKYVRTRGPFPTTQTAWSTASTWWLKTVWPNLSGWSRVHMQTCLEWIDLSTQWLKRWGRWLREKPLPEGNAEPAGCCSTSWGYTRIAEETMIQMLADE